MPRKYTKKPKGRKMARKPSVALVQTIKKVLHAEIETKEAYHAQVLTLQNPDIYYATDILRIVPNIAQGIDSNQRIGVKVRAMTLNVRGHLLLSNAGLSTTTCRIAVRMFCVQPRSTTSFAVISQAVAGGNFCQNLLAKGGASVPFTGTISDLYSPIDMQNSATVLYDRIHYLTVPIQLTAVGALEVRQTIKFFNFSKKINKVLAYVDALDSLQPQNLSPILLLGYTLLDGTAPTPSQTAISIAFDSTMTYEDA